MAQDRAETAGMQARQGAGGAMFTAALALAWVLGALPGVLFHQIVGPGSLIFGTDDAMRLVQVRDLLGGQGWFDLTQYRLGPAGIEMHWSRLVDAPIAGLILALTPLLGPAAAETAAIYAWPLILLGPPLAATAAAGRTLAGTPGLWVAPLLMALQLSQSGRFIPGMVDHHNLQVAILVVAIALAAVATRRPRAAVGVGAAMATSLAVGVEFVPVIAALALCAGLGWVVDGPASRRQIIGLTAGFSAVLAALFVLTAPASAWRGGFCDALGLDLALPALAGAGLLGLGAAFGPAFGPAASAGARLAILAVAGAAAAAMALAVVPACLADPLAGIDPFLREHWLDRVSEAGSWAALLRDSPHTELPILGAALLATAASAVMFVREPAERWLWAMLGGAILLSVALAFWQQRAGTVLPPLSALPVAILGVRLYLSARARDSLPRALGAIAFVFVATPTIWALVRPAPGPPAETGIAAAGETARPLSMTDLWSCYRPEELAVLADLPPGLVSASSNLGAHILLAGPHRVLSAPYHRNTLGMTEQLRIALADDAGAERRLRELGVAHVVTCARDGEYQDRGRDGFAYRLARGTVPAFLERTATGPGGIVTVYRLRPEN